MKRWSYLGPGTGYKKLPLNINDFRSIFSGNTGNLIYYYATQCVTKCTGKPLGLGTSTEVFNKLNNGLVLSMANHLGSHTNLSENGLKLDNLSVPVVALGLGAQVKEETDDLSYIPEGTREWLSKLVDKAPSTFENITVRGDYTFRVMEKLGFGDNVISIGCQSNFINSNQNLGETISNKINMKHDQKLSIAAGNPFEKVFSKLEVSLLELAHQSKGDYIVQHPLSLIQLVTKFTDKEFENSWEKIFPIYEKHGIKEDLFSDLVRNTFKLYIDAPQWIGSHRQSDIVVGTRIHGVQSALQAGVPAVCLYIDSRTKELCHKMKIPSASAMDYVNGIKREDIVRILNDWDYEAYDKNRLELAKKFKVFLANNNIPISNTMEILTTNIK